MYFYPFLQDIHNWYLIVTHTNASPDQTRLILVNLQLDLLVYLRILELPIVVKIQKKISN